MPSLDESSTADVNRLPEYWPEVPPAAPMRAWWIPWPVAVVLVPLLWLMPKRMGPHFEAVRWPGVIVGHVFWTLYGIGCVDLAYWAPHYGWIAWLTGQSPGQAEPSLWPPAGAWDIFRAPLALEATWLAQEVIKDVATYFLALGTFLGGELAVAAMGLLLMPFVAAGERSWRLLARCVKLTLWATTSAVLLGLAVQAAVLAWPASAHKKAIITAICAGYLGWFLWFWLRMGLRYAGAAEGPAWRSRRPTCEGCGYSLTGLTTADHCPECGREVALSMPEHRKPTAYAAARGLGRGPAFFATALRVLVDGSYFERVSMRDAHPAARRFAIRMCLLASGITAGLSPLGAMYQWHWAGWINVDGWAEWTAAFLAVWMGLFAIMVGLTAVAASTACAWGLLPVRTRATVVFYHSVWLAPLGILAMFAMTCLLVVGKGRVWRGSSYASLSSLPPGMMLFYVAVALTGLVAVAGVLRAAGGVRRVRFANG